MKKYQTHFLFLVFILLSLIGILAGCKKKNEASPPIVNVLSPSENSSFENKTIIEVRITASDKNQIEWVRITVNDENNVAISNQEKMNFHSPEVDQIFDLYLNATNNVSTAAYIVVTASNGELETKKYVKIKVTEKPNDLTGFITIQKDGFYTRIFHENTTGAVMHSTNFQGDYLQSGFESKNQLFVCAGKSNSLVKAIKLPDFTEVWSNTDARTYSLMIDKESFYIAQANKYITAYYTQGYTINRSYHEPSFDFHPNCVAVGTGVVCSFQWQLVNNGPKKITVFDSNTSGILKEAQTTNIVTQMVHLQNNIFLLLSNTTIGTSKLEQYNYNNNTITQLYNTDSVSKILRINENKVLVLKNYELGIFDVSNSTYIELIEKPNIKAIVYNPAEDRVYISAGNKIEIYSMTGYLENTINFAHPIDDFCLTYNN